jgi:hypothetical protein
MESLDNRFTPQVDFNYTSFFHWLTLSVVDHGFDPDQVIPKTIKLVFAASQLSMQHKGVKA